MRLMVSNYIKLYIIFIEHNAFIVVLFFVLHVLYRYISPCFSDSIGIGVHMGKGRWMKTQSIDVSKAVLCMYTIEKC